MVPKGIAPHNCFKHLDILILRQFWMTSNYICKLWYRNLYLCVRYNINNDMASFAILAKLVSTIALSSKVVVARHRLCLYLSSLNATHKVVSSFPGISENSWIIGHYQATCKHHNLMRKVFCRVQVMRSYCLWSLEVCGMINDKYLLKQTTFYKRTQH